MLRTDISSESDIVKLPRCCLALLFSWFNLIQEVDTWSLNFYLEVQQRTNGIFIG